MKAKCSRPALSEALQLASSIVPSRTPKPILQCARLEAISSDQQLLITATDGELSIQYKVPQVEVLEDGVAVVSAEKITAILRESVDDVVSLNVADDICEVVGQDSWFKIYGHDPDDFPTVEGNAKDGTWTVSGETLRRMIEETVFAAARESTRYAINGVLWERDGKKLRLVATDGRRLASSVGDVSAEKGSQEEAIVPVKVMSVLDRLIHDDDDVSVSFVGNQLFVSSPLAEVVGTLVQGRFPKYEDVIPGECTRKAQLEVDALRSAVRRVALLTNEQSRGVKLSFDEKGLCLSSSTPEAGDAEIRMAMSYDGDPLEIGFNPQYILDMLKVVREPEVVFEFTENSRPGLVRAGKFFLYVIMPVTTI